MRQDDPLSFVLMIKVMLITVLLLALVYVGLRWYARRHARTVEASPGQVELQCGRALRLSTKTKVYLLKTDTAQVLVTESSNGATVTVLPDPVPTPARDAHS
ncbi:hypothetical protein HX882_07880 [Pseudomonas gingeri]|uniref:Uncharacterized protein n=1 Tax=Pseudomonas gingeri TaxID=117681 RepID=A0A7Y7XBQ5_9PSED|nr:hypothetical protein [Pseudomonas gingeri]